MSRWLVQAVWLFGFRKLRTDSLCSQSAHSGSKSLGIGSAAQLAPRAGTQGTLGAFVIPKCFTFHLSQQDSTGWKGVRDPPVGNRLLPQEQHIWATAWEPMGRRVACVPVAELCWWQQLTPNCSSDGDCFGVPGCSRNPVTGQGLWIKACALQEHCWWREGLDPLCCRWTTQLHHLGQLRTLAEKYLWIAKRL